VVVDEAITQGPGKLPRDQEITQKPGNYPGSRKLPRDQEITQGPGKIIVDLGKSAKSTKYWSWDHLAFYHPSYPT